MTLLGWIRVKVWPHDPVKAEAVEAIKGEKSRLNGAVVELSRAKNDLGKILDDTLSALDRERHR